MSFSIDQIRACQGRRVRMRFDDGLEVAAYLDNVTQDFDGSIHLVYDHAVKLDGLPNALVQSDQIYYATSRSLVEIHPLNDSCNS